MCVLSGKSVAVTTLVAAMAAMTTASSSMATTAIDPAGNWRLQLKEQVGVSTRYRNDPAATKSGRISKNEFESIANEFLASPEGQAIRQMMGPQMPERVDTQQLLASMPTEIEVRKLEGRNIEITYPETVRGRVRIVRHRLTLNSANEGEAVINRTPMRPMPGTQCAKAATTTLKVKFKSSTRMDAAVSYEMSLRTMGQPSGFFDMSCEGILLLVNMMADQPGENGAENGLKKLLDELERRELINRSLIESLEGLSTDLEFDGRKS